MKKPRALKRGDKIAIVSLSDGALGEDFVKHEIILLEKRLKEDFGLNCVYMDNARKGINFLREHPEARAEDLVQAFKDKNIKATWTAIGGDDTFRTLPYLMNDGFKKIVNDNPKIFIGMSDTTNNHFMLYKMGLMTYYGPAVLSDIAELGPKIFPYAKNWLMELFDPTPNKRIMSSKVWYGERKSFGVDQLGVERPSNKEGHGIEFLYGNGTLRGELLGGCLDSIYEMLEYGRYDDQKTLFEKYPIFPEADVWKNKILFLETSEEKPTPERFKKMLDAIEDKDVFSNVSGIFFGKPQGEAYYDEYKKILLGVAKKYKLPLVYNVNFGHITPRIVLPYGQEIEVDFSKKTLHIPKPMVETES